MASKNLSIIIGFLGKDPDVKTIAWGNVHASLSVAVSEKYKNKEGKYVENTEWINVSVWGQSASYIEKYAKKGDQVFVEGSIKTRSWEDKDGNKKYLTEVVAKEVQLLGKKSTKDESDDLPQPF
jgi:single-strand DNA-binding protein